MTAKGKPKYQVAEIMLRNMKVKVYASPRVKQAFEELSLTKNMWEGVKLSQLLEALYKQGLKDGARRVFEKIEKVKKEVPHRIPGRPRSKAA